MHTMSHPIHAAPLMRGHSHRADPDILRESEANDSRGDFSSSTKYVRLLRNLAFNDPLTQFASRGLESGSLRTGELNSPRFCFGKTPENSMGDMRQFQKPIGSGREWVDSQSLPLTFTANHRAYIRQSSYVVAVKKPRIGDNTDSERALRVRMLRVIT